MVGEEGEKERERVSRERVIGEREDERELG